MGATIYGFLGESFLFSDDLIEDHFKALSENEIRKELRAYREYCISHLDEIEDEVRSKVPLLKVFSGLHRVEPNLFKQSAFYVDQHIVQDPLFPFTHEGGSMNKALSEYLSYADRGINRSELSSILKFLKSVTPMVAANYVKFLPTSYLYEPKEQTPVYYSESFFAELLPTTIMEFFQKRATVQSMRKKDEGWEIEDRLNRSRGIIVRFGEDLINEARVYHLFENAFSNFNERDNSVEVRMTLPDSPPSVIQFDTWMRQSINRAASDICERVVSEVSIGEKLGAAYMTDSLFVSDLMRQVHSAEDSIALYTANTLINMDLPFLDKVDEETLMKVRQDDGQAFKNFRVELESKFRELRLESDRERFQVRLANAIHELKDVQLHKVREKVKEIRKGALIDSVVLSAGLYGSYQVEGLSLLVGGLALARGYKAASEYWGKVRQNPSFFLWKVLKEK